MPRRLRAEGAEEITIERTNERVCEGIRGGGGKEINVRKFL
jgi:hypothetical protein